MSFTITCPHCSKTLRVTEPAFGKTVPCPGCGQPIEVPWPSASSQTAVPLLGSSTGLDCDAAPLPAGMPPMPPGMPPMPGRAGQPALRMPAGSPPPGYSRPPSLGIAGVKERMTRTATLLKNRVLALRLKHQINGLSKAAEGQLELLGALALTHRPPTVDVAQELAELSGIQDQVGEKQTTVGSLRQTRGSGSVVKEMNTEIAELQARQRTVAIGIGRKAAAARAEMPGAAGPYAALDRLNTALTTKQTDLAAIEDETTALGTAKAMDLGSLGRPVFATAAVAGAIVCLGVLWLLWGSLPLGGGVPKSIRSHMSADTQWIGYCNLHALRKTPLWSEIEAMGPPDKEIDLKANWAFGAEEIREGFAFAAIGEAPCVIVRTYDDVPLEEAVLRGVGYSAFKEHEGYKYTALGKAYGAKTGKCIYCETQSEDAMKSALGHVSQRESRELSDNLERAIANVAASDYYVAADSAMLVTFLAPALQAMRKAMRNPYRAVNEERVEALTGLVKASLSAEYVAMAIEITDSVRFHGYVGFRKAEDAAAFESSLRYIVENGPNLILADVGDDASDLQTAQEVSSILRAIAVRVRGSRVDIDAQVEMDTFAKHLRQFRHAFAGNRLRGL